MNVLGEEYYTIEEAAQLLKVDRRTIAAWRKKGKIQPTQVGGRRILYTHAELQKMISRPVIAQPQTA